MVIAAFQGAVLALPILLVVVLLGRRRRGATRR